MVLGWRAQATAVPRLASSGNGLVERELAMVCCGHGFLSATVCVTHLIFFFFGPKIL